MKIQELPAYDNSCGGFPFTNRPVCPSHEDRRPAHWALRSGHLADLVARFGKFVEYICGTPGYTSDCSYTAICGAPATGWFAEEYRAPNDLPLLSAEPNCNPLEPRFSLGMNAKSQWGITGFAETVNKNRQVI
ncbi:hypothetical protein CRPA25_32100 [Pseudomonas aeruginosa]|nr:hypothetical protein BGP81_12150 [Pseudomonas putida]